MADSDKRGWLGFVVAVVTPVVAIGSLYYTYVQADVARRQLDMAWREKVAGTEKKVAELERKLAEGMQPAEVASLLKQVAGLQAKLADQHLESLTHPDDKSRAETQRELAGLTEKAAQLKQAKEQQDQELARLKKENLEQGKQLALAQNEAARLRSQVATAPNPLRGGSLLTPGLEPFVRGGQSPLKPWKPLWPGLVTPGNLPRLPGDNLLLPGPKIGSGPVQMPDLKGLDLPPVKWPSLPKYEVPLKPMPAPQPDGWSWVKQHWGMTLFWGIMLLIALGSRK